MSIVWFVLAGVIVFLARRYDLNLIPLAIVIAVVGLIWELFKATVKSTGRAWGTGVAEGRKEADRKDSASK